MANDIIITINDYVNKTSTSYQVDGINNDMTIREIIEKIKRMKNYSHPTNNLVVYFARVECLADSKLSTYNKSNRKMIKLELYLSNEITINVNTLNSCGSGNARCIPLWAFCCKQTIKVRISDTCEVRTLKQRIYDMTDESRSIPVENIVLLYKGAPLNNFLTLKESELVDNCKVDYFVPLCYIYKAKDNKKEQVQKAETKKEGEDKKMEPTKSYTGSRKSDQMQEHRGQTFKPESSYKKKSNIQASKTTA